MGDIIKNDFLNKIGNTPLIKLKNLYGNTNVYAKLEYYNYFGSIKDRAALYIISKAEAQKRLRKDAVIIEATSGNMGIALAGICKIKEYSCLIAMPENMSEKRKALISGCSAKLLLTPAEKGMNAAILKVKELKRSNPNFYFVDQFNNYDCVLAHQNYTAPEIYKELNKKVDVIIAGVGTGATITGIGRFFKKINPDIEIIGILPESYPHQIQGIGPGFIPPLLNMNYVDKIITVSDTEAFEEKKKIFISDGLYVGISSGAVIAGLKKILKIQVYNGKNIVLIFADGGERYQE